MRSVSVMPNVTSLCVVDFTSLLVTCSHAVIFSVLQGLTASHAYGNSLTTAPLLWSIPTPKASSHP